jgi:hypothetical protein
MDIHLPLPDKGRNIHESMYGFGIWHDDCDKLHDLLDTHLKGKETPWEISVHHWATILERDGGQQVTTTYLESNALQAIMARLPVRSVLLLIVLQRIGHMELSTHCRTRQAPTIGCAIFFRA